MTISCGLGTTLKERAAESRVQGWSEVALVVLSNAQYDLPLLVYDALAENTLWLQEPQKNAGR